jgi:uncharacterized protein
MVHTHGWFFRTGCLLLLCFAPFVHGEGKRLSRYLTDETNSLNNREQEMLERKLSDFDEATSTQLVVLVIPTLGGESIESASLRVAEENGIGRKEKNNGVLLFIAKVDRRIRIEVGYGLEGVLTDVVCGQIIRQEIAPRFREGKFFDGISAGVDAIILATQNEYTAEKTDHSTKGLHLLPIVFIIMLFVYFSRIRRQRAIGGLMPPVFFPGGRSGRGSSGWGGGGFSGGGGSFGGGGASGSW